MTRSKQTSKKTPKKTKKAEPDNRPTWPTTPIKTGKKYQEHKPVESPEPIRKVVPVLPPEPDIRPLLEKDLTTIYIESVSLRDLIHNVRVIYPHWYKLEKTGFFPKHCEKIRKSIAERSVTLYDPKYPTIQACPEDAHGIHAWTMDALRKMNEKPKTSISNEQPEFSRIMSKQEMATALGLSSVYKLNVLIEEAVYEVERVGENRQSWQIRIDKLDKSLQKKLKA